jgi:hypothetical protein
LPHTSCEERVGKVFQELPKSFSALHPQSAKTLKGVTLILQQQGILSYIQNVNQLSLPEKKRKKPCIISPVPRPPLKSSVKPSVLTGVLKTNCTGNRMFLSRKTSLVNGKDMPLKISP